MAARVMLMLAQGAHAVNGALYVLGGGIRTIVSGMPYTIVAVIEVDYLDATAAHRYCLSLYDRDDNPVMAEDEAGNDVPVEFKLPPIDTGIPAGHRPGIPIDVMLAVPAPSIDLAPGEYRWKVRVDDEMRDEWRLAFSVIAARPQAVAA